MRNLLLIFTLCFTPVLHAAQTITWDTLRPEVEQQVALAPADKALLTEIYVYQVAQQTRQLSPMEHDGYTQRVALAEKRGIDVRAAMAQLVHGQASSNAVIEDLAFDDMQLAGFLVPLELDGLKGTQFILVPTAGACIHTPPPPTNQMVLVEFEPGFELTSLYSAVWVKGDIQAGSVSANLALSDGSQAIQTGYVIKATDIVAYQ